MGHRIFVYGSLMFPSVYEGVTGTSPDYSEATLSGFSRFAVRDSPGNQYPAIIPDPAGVVVGKVVSGVTADELAALDRFEEVGAGLYRRRLVTVQGAAGYLEAEAYIASDKLRTKLQGNWDPNVFEATYLGEYLATVVAHFRVEEAVRVQSEKG